MFRRLFRRAASAVAQQSAPVRPPEPPVQADPRRLEIYLGQIADLPEHDRAIIIGVLQGILDEEAAADQANTDR